jgi:hypothetical protein
MGQLGGSYAPNGRRRLECMPQDNSIACRLYLRKRADLNKVKHDQWADPLRPGRDACTTCKREQDER